jgi:hypothetical protein
MKEKEEAAIKALVAESGCAHSPELVEELIETALRLGRDKAPVADLKLFVRALKELRYASKVFQPERSLGRVAGSYPAFSPLPHLAMWRFPFLQHSLSSKNYSFNAPTFHGVKRSALPGLSSLMFQRAIEQ